MAAVRYIVDDVEAAVGFYTEHLGFEVELFPAPAFAALRRGDLRLYLNSPGGPGGAAQPAVDGRSPEPGGWSRFQIEVDGIEGVVDELRAGGVGFRTELVTGIGGKQVLLEDPSGNCVELFERGG